MNKYLTKIAKEDKSGNGAGWVIPAAMAAVPVVAMGVSRHGEHDLKMKHGPANPKLESALMRRNIKTTAALTGATIAAAGIGEYARRSFATKQKDEQTKDIKKVVNQAVSKAVEKQAEEKPHDWKPAVVGAAAELPIAMGVGDLGKLTSQRFFGGKYENAAMGVIGGLTAAGEADFLQRRAEGHHKKEVEEVHNKYLNKIASIEEEKKRSNVPSRIGGAVGGVAGYVVGGKVGSAISSKLPSSVTSSKLGIVAKAAPIGIGRLAGAIYGSRAGYKATEKIRGKDMSKAAGLGKHNDVPDSKFPKKELEMGRKTEREHTDDYQTAENIAKDHLSESKKYYSKLKVMEKKKS